MQHRSRRQYLQLSGGAVAVALAGCVAGDDDDRPDFLVTDTAFSIQDSGDMNVQITIENGSGERQRSDVEIIVRYTGGDETKDWEQTDTVELAGATEMTRQYQFEDVYQPGSGPEDYDIDAQLVDS